MCAERAWAAHLELKATAAANSTVRRLSIRRLAKAVVFASRFREQCEKHGDKLCVLEARAYEGLFKGALATERRQWKSVVETLTPVRHLLIQFQRLAATSTHAAALQDAAALTDTSIRTASYYLARQGVDVAALQAELGRPAVEQAAPKEEETHRVTLMWRGVETSIPQALTTSSGYAAVSAALQTDVSVEREQEHQQNGKRRGEPISWKAVQARYRPVQNAIAQCQSALHESMLSATTDAHGEREETTAASPTDCFLLETLVRDWETCLAIEMFVTAMSQCVKCATSIEVPTRSRASLAVYFGSIILKVCPMSSLLGLSQKTALISS